MNESPVISLKFRPQQETVRRTVSIGPETLLHKQPEREQLVSDEGERLRVSLSTQPGKAIYHVLGRS